ncbi:MAG TPA: TetM/TetW/TetO/TetS family tetracycline resistance ribosomal protection protein [Firmicutes bacterium]|nr:TetM/TetW/TetO/TetS family tetracycline resistance ribosomal protection protein [Bacillota bacterium]
MKKLTIGILAHVDAGKTTLTEQLLYRSGGLREAGSVDAGTAHTDFLEVERRRGISVKASSAEIEYGDMRLYIIDTPGHVDFASEVERALAVLDAAVLVISAADGIEAQTEVLWEALTATGTRPILFFNKTDRVGSDLAGCREAVKKRFTPHILDFTSLQGEGTRDCSVGLRTLDDPDFFAEALERTAEWDENMLEAYLSDSPPDKEALATSLRRQIAEGHIMPALCGSALCGVGAAELLRLLADYIEPLRSRPDDKLSAVVYGISHDKTMGRIAHVRMFGGRIQNRDTVHFAAGGEGKVSQIRRYIGSRFVDVGEASRGDVAALCGLSDAKVGDIIGEAAHLTGYELSVPLLKVRVLPKKPEELYALTGALNELAAEDPKLDVEFAPEEKEVDIHITGTIQLEILSALLQSRYGLEVDFSAPTVIYKETPTHPGRGFTAYTMPKPCWAVIDLYIEPGPRGSGLAYHSEVPNDQIFYRYQNHIETALPRALKQGLYNWEVTDLKVTLVGGEHHTVHTHPLDFFLATPMAVMNGLQNTGTTLLEPMQDVRISAPEEFVGKVIGDMIAMRGVFDSPVIAAGRFTMEARVPASTFMDYTVRLASLTAGRGMVSVRFAGYQPCPLELGQVAKRRGVNPLDREKWILTQRSAMQG